MFKPLLIATLFLFTNCLFAQQNHTSKQISQGGNPFRTNVFVENLGQFNSWIKNENDKILFAVNNGDKIFFTPNKLIFRIDRLEKRDEKEIEYLEKGNIGKEEEENEKKKFRMKDNYVQMQWMGSNVNVIVKGNEKAKGYYTFGEKGYENIKANGYEKLSYENLYKGIDVEYNIPSADSNGIKYKIIIHPDGDYHSIKMNYDGDVSIDKTGNAIIESKAGKIIDHAPNAFYLENEKSLAVKFIKDENGYLCFDFPHGAENNKTIIIDPWTVTPSSLTNNNQAYDVDYDDFGNVYVEGGYFPYKLAKYDPLGNILWTYTTPITFSSAYQEYSEFGLIHSSGSSFIGEGYSNPGSPKVLKINSAGAQILMVTTSVTNELWSINYNSCSGKLLGFGGGNLGPQNDLFVFSDTSLTSTSLINFNGAVGPGSNDIADAVIDANGDFYALMATNLIQKSLQSTGYNPPTAFNVSSGYAFLELCSTGIFAGSVCLFDHGSNRVNALAVNSNYLFSYDGLKLKAWNKTSGAVLDSIVVNAGYIGGQNRTHEGIAVDECNNVYAGGNQSVHTYSFNGIVFTSTGNITSNVPDEVYDVTLNEAQSTLYVSGKGFLSSLTVTPCAGSNLSITATASPSCSPVTSATVTVTGGTPPYTYQWSNGSTTSVASNLSNGTYTVTVWDASCIQKTGTTTVTITITPGLSLAPNTNNVTCNGNSNGSASVTASNGVAPYTYIWNTSPPQSAQTATGLSSGTYSVTVTDSNGCTGTQTVTITQPSALTTTISSTPANCSGNNGTATVNSSGGTGNYTYSWNPSVQTSQTATNLTAGNYSVTVTDSIGCTSTNTITVASTGSISATAGPNSTICSGQTASLTASGGNNYSWSNGNTTSVINISPSVSTTYSVIVSNGVCSDTSFVSVVVSPPPIAFVSSSTICSGQTATLTASGGGNYSWSNGNTNSSINVSPTITSTYSVIVSSGSCADTAFATVTINPSPTVSVSGNTTLCIGDIATLTASGGNNYLWSNGSSTTVINVSPSITTTYTVSTSNGNCTSTTSVTVIVSAPPTASANNVIICEGQTATLAASGGGNYSWSNGSTTNPFIVSPTSTSNYSVIVSIGSCSDTASGTVTVNPNPTAVAFSNISIQQGQSTTLSASGGGTYSWSNGGNSSVIIVAPLITTGYCVTVSNGSCIDTACVLVVVEPIDCGFADDQLFVPDAFSPNNDTKNDVLGVYYPNISCIKEFMLIIYDRWGEKIFEADNITAQWNGTYKGELMNTAVFVYYMKVTFLSGNETVRKGNVSLIR